MQTESKQNEICRVVKRETVRGTFYFAQRLIVRGWFNKRLEWEIFDLYERNTIGINEYVFAEPDWVAFGIKYYPESFKDDSKRAERLCELYTKHMAPDEIVKVWSKDG